MEGRRVNHSAPKRNPLYVMFLCLVAAVFVLLIVVIVLGAKLVDRGTKVKAAAKKGNWTFVSVGSKFGWISSDYLSTKPPAEVTSGSLSRT